MSPAPPLPATPVNDSHRILAHDQASAILPSDFKTRVAWHARRRLRHLYFQEFPRRAFAQPFLPHEEIRPAQSTLRAGRSNIQSTTRLLGNQLSPLRPCLLCSFGHVATLLCDTIFHKMGFVYSLLVRRCDWRRIARRLN